MNATGGSTPALLGATLSGTALQVAMVVAGHYSATIAGLFPVLGVSISLVTGLLYGIWAGGPGARRAAGGGAVAGGACALIGIAVSVLLGDVPASVLAFGTAMSALAGALGGLLGDRLAARRSVRPA